MPAPPKSDCQKKSTNAHPCRIWSVLPKDLSHLKYIWSAWPPLLLSMHHRYWQNPVFRLPYRDYQNHIQENGTFHSSITDKLLSHRNHYKIFPANERVYPLFLIVYMPDTDSPYSSFSDDAFLDRPLSKNCSTAYNIPPLPCLSSHFFWHKHPAVPRTWRKKDSPFPP